MKLILPLTLLLVSVSAMSQTSLITGPKVNGLALGDSREDVLRWMGKPTSQSKKKADECVGGTEMTITYPGLKFVLWDDPQNPKKFTIGRFEVTSSKWNVSGARVGQTSSAIRKLFGTRGVEQKDRGETVWYYEMDEHISPGDTTFYFRGGKVTKIYAMWLMC